MKVKESIIDRCVSAFKAINSVIDEIIASRQSEVEKLASEIFIKLTNAPNLYTGIQLNPEYELQIKTIGNRVRNVWDQEPSAGSSQIIAYSFISALNRFTAREAPVIIDTPIGRLDPIHKENLIRYFHDIGPQVLILYQPSELHDNDIRKMRRYISSEWELKRDSTDPYITKIFNLEKL